MAERKVMAGKSGMFPISSRGPKVDLHLEKNDPAKYHVIEKDIPTDLPTVWKEMKITWFTCFGVRHRKEDGGDGEYADVDYSIQLDDMAGKTFLTFYDNDIHELEKDNSVGGGKVRLKFKKGDPPVGMIPP